jgi:acyl-CoA synthetase (AMP-forming)/AMP-acid ligase II
VQIGKDITTIREALDAMAGANPEAEFLISAETGSALSFLELQQQCFHLSLMLHEAGLVRGDKIALLMDNGLLTVRLFLGAMYGGVVAVPLNARAGATQLSYMLEHCEAKIVFVEEQYAQLLQEAPAEVHRDIRVISVSVDGPLSNFEPVSSAAWPSCPAADDAALLMFSSGSTGKPEAVIHTHSTLLAQGRSSIASHQLTSADRSLLVLPLYHINAECVTLIPSLLSGGSVVVARHPAVSIRGKPPTGEITPALDAVSR